jgi:hypothetical protein
MMLRMKQQNGTPGNGIGGLSNSQVYRLGNDALPQSAQNLIQKQRQADQTPFNVYHDQSDVPLNLNPRQVQNVEDQYLAYRYNSGTGFNPATRQGQNSRNNTSTSGPTSHSSSSHLHNGLTESQLLRSSYNMAKDKSNAPPLPNVHPNHNLGEYKMYETQPV